MTELKQVPLSAQELAEKQRKDRLIQIMLDDLEKLSFPSLVREESLRDYKCLTYLSIE